MLGGQGSCEIKKINPSSPPLPTACLPVGRAGRLYKREELPLFVKEGRGEIFRLGDDFLGPSLK
jgi:hypothetical protein